MKHAHPASSYAVVGVAAFVTVKNDIVKSVRLAIGGVTPTPVLVSSVDAALSGLSPSAKAVADACESVPDALEFPLGDIYASGEYRTHLAKVLSARALTEAFKRAKKQK